MIELDPTRFKLTPYPHQLAGVKTLLKRPRYGLFWEMRLGKTKVVIDAACTLFEAGALDAVIVVAPAQVKDVWCDSELGEIRKHCWLPFSGRDGVGVLNYRVRSEEMLEDWFFNYERSFIITSFEFLRQENAFRDYEKVKQLLDVCKHRNYWLVIDEGAAIANHKANQTKAVALLAKHASRVTVLDGTPVGNSPLDLYSKFAVLDKSILGYKNYWEFERTYALQWKIRLQGRRPFNKVIGYQHLDELTEKTKDHCEYLTQRDVFKNMKEPVTSFISVQLSKKTWGIYRSLRDELLAELETGKCALNNSAAKVMRLAQVCGGFLGGVEAIDEAQQQKTLQELSSETCDALIDWVQGRLAENRNFKCIVWCRFVPELERVLERLRELRLPHGCIYGADRYNEAFLNPSNGYEGPFVLVAQPQAAQFGLNLSKADTEVWLSRDYNRVTAEQASARYKAPDGKVRLSMSVLVTGPDGQHTIVHDIIKSLREKENVAERTTDQWRKVLSE